MPDNAGAEAAFRGYRTQTIYILYRLSQQTKNETFFPETSEDLLIKSELQNEFIQVKNYSSDLVLSKIISFFERIPQFAQTDLVNQFKLISFGKLGVELNELKNTSKSPAIRKKLLEKKYFTKEQVDYIFENLTIEVCDEGQLMEEISSWLESSIAGIDIKSAFELMMYWLYEISENKDSISKDNLIKKVLNIGKFLSERFHFLSQFGSSILPIRESLENEVNYEKLRDQFYLGLTSNYYHIEANLDVVRESKMIALENGFKQNDSVIIHGASGQGKSTLALRFIHENFPEGFVFKIQPIENQESLNQIVAAIKSLSKPFESPFLIYIDVKPGNSYWVNLIQQISIIENCKILITIREEDLNRAEGINEFINPTGIKLTFNRDEALEIYRRLNQKKRTLKFLNFEDAWTSYGEGNLLLEFVYLLNQGESLKSRLANQVKRIKEFAKTQNEWEQVEFLKKVAFAHSYDCRINVKKLVDTVSLKDPAEIIKWFEDEYLIRESGDGKILESLHSIRSKILVEILFDPVIDDFEKITCDTLKIVEENDVGLLLFHAFADLENYDLILEELPNYQTTRWISFEGILSSLLWLGLKKYKSENLIHLKKMKEVNAGWKIFIPLIFHKGIDFSFMKDLMGEGNFEKVMEVRDSFSPRENIFKYAISWLQKTNLPEVEYCNERDLSCFGKSLFWMGELGVSKEIDFEIYRFDEIFDVQENELGVPVEVLAEMLLGLYYFSVESRKLNKKFRTSFLERFRITYQVPKFEETEKTVNLHYIFNLELDGDNQDYDLNGRSVNLLRTIRKAFPEKETYAIEGFGHEVSFLELGHNPTLKKMPAKNLGIEWLTEMNSVYLNLIEYDERAKSWNELVNNLFTARKEILTLLRKLKIGIEKFFKNRKLQTIEDYWTSFKSDWYNLELKLELLFPQSVVDKWGFVKDNISSTPIERIQSENRKSLLLQIQPKLQDIKDFQNDLGNFFKQSSQVIQSKVLEKILTPDESKKGKHIARVSCINFSNALKKLGGYQEAFSEYFNQYILINDLEKMEKEEKTLYEDILFLWVSFCSASSKKSKNISKDLQLKIQRIRSEVDGKIEFQLNKLKVQKYFFDFEIIEDEENIANTFIVTYHENIAECYIAPLEIMKVLQKQLKIGEYPTIPRFIIDVYFQNFVIVPLIKDVSPDLYCVRLSSENLLYRGTINSIGAADVSKLTDGEISFLEIQKV